MFVLFSAVVPAAFAGDDGQKPPAIKCDKSFFYLGAVHSINGQRLGLARELPVDVYVNGEYSFTFEFKDQVGPVKLDAGKYTIDVRLKGAPSDSDPVMSLGPVEIPGCVKVVVVARLVDGKPTLVPKITELASKKS